MIINLDRDIKNDIPINIPASKEYYIMIAKDLAKSKTPAQIYDQTDIYFKHVNDGLSLLPNHFMAFLAHVKYQQEEFRKILEEDHFDLGFLHRYARNNLKYDFSFDEIKRLAILASPTFEKEHSLLLESERKKMDAQKVAMKGTFYG